MTDLVLRPDRIAAGGDAIARHPDGRVVFVDGAIPGETVRVRLTSAKKDFVRTAVAEVIEASPDRVEPPCRHVDAGCGGCGWQHISLVRQRRLKVELVADSVRRIAKLGPEVDVAALVELGADLPGDAFRTTVRAGVTDDGRLGYRRAQSNAVVPVADCLVAHPALQDLLVTKRWRGMEEVVLRTSVATGERLVWWTGRGTAPQLPADVLLGDHHAVTEEVQGARLQVSARSFFQSSPYAAVALADTVRELAAPWLGRSERVIDAYSGVGLFAATVVPVDQPVTAIELSASSCADARVNLADRNATIIEGSVDDWIPESADLVIADPARNGLGAAAADRLVATDCAALVLVSCEAAAGARDLKLLTERGFGVDRVVVLDPFPHTAHVEVVTLLTRRGRHGPS